MRLIKQRTPAIVITDKMIDVILQTSKFPGITLAILCYMERNENQILMEEEIASALGFDYQDVRISLSFLELIGYLKINN